MRRLGEQEKVAAIITTENKFFPSNTPLANESFRPNEDGNATGLQDITRIETSDSQHQTSLTANHLSEDVEAWPRDGRERRPSRRGHGKKPWITLPSGYGAIRMKKSDN